VTRKPATLNLPAGILPRTPAEVDATPAEHLSAVWYAYTRRPGVAARILWGSARPARPIVAAQALGNYAINRAALLRCEPGSDGAACYRHSMSLCLDTYRQAGGPL
jgi:hypothetical protein